MIQVRSNIKILVIDDDEDDYILTREQLILVPGNNFEIDWCPSYKEALGHLANPQHHLYFADFRLGAKSGVDLLIEARNQHFLEPIILLTGQGNHSVDLQAMQSGAVDYMAKGELTTEKLERSIRYAMERTKYLKALQLSERKYRTIFDRSNDVLFLADMQLRFLDINPAGPLLTGQTKDQLLQTDLYQLMHNRSQQLSLRKMLEMGKGVSDFELTLSGAGGTYMHCILSLSMEKGSSRESTVQGMIHDISNLKQAEQDKMQREKMAAAARLAKTIAHEVRNPLNNITLSVDHLRYNDPHQQLEPYLDILERNSRRINDLVRELLLSASPEPRQPSRLSVRQLVHELGEECADRLRLKAISLVCALPEQDLYIKADKEKVKLALLNILNNALDAVQEKTGRIGIATEDMEDMVAITISDNGQGISEEELPRIFEPYFSRKKNGIGLGLTLSMSILQSYQAKVTVTSQKGEGTAFKIIMPVDQLAGRNSQIQ